MADSTDAEGRVTLAVVGQRLTVMEATLATINHKLDRINDCTATLTTQSQLNKAKIESHDGDLNRHEHMIEGLDDKLDDLNKKSNFWDGINSAFIGVATALNMLVGGNK